MTVESYLHKYSKIVVASWLRKKIKLNDKYKRLVNVNLEVNGFSSPMFNVYEEYPVCIQKTNASTSANVSVKPSIIGLDISWKDWCDANKKSFSCRHGIPSLYELKELKDMKILHIFDIGIVDNGKLKYVFEIQHTSPSCEEKIKFINDNKLIGYELGAQQIMELIKPPFNLEYIHKWNC